MSDLFLKDAALESKLHAFMTRLKQQGVKREAVLGATRRLLQRRGQNQEQSQCQPQPTPLRQDDAPENIACRVDA